MLEVTFGIRNNLLVPILLNFIYKINSIFICLYNIWNSLSLRLRVGDVTIAMT